MVQTGPKRRNGDVAYVKRDVRVFTVYASVVGTIGGLVVVWAVVPLRLGTTVGTVVPVVVLDGVGLRARRMAPLQQLHSSKNTGYHKVPRKRYTTHGKARVAVVLLWPSP